MAQDLTAEADSAGHTDNRPALTLLPTMLALRDRLQEEFGYALPLRVGLGGGIGTPEAAAAAFAMGAAYIVTGSINQACVESGSSDKVRQMLAQTQQADVMMAPAADMFEMGVKLQVLKRGTMFPMRAAKLFELYRAYNSLEEIPPTERAAIEKTIFRDTLGKHLGQKPRSSLPRSIPRRISTRASPKTPNTKWPSSSAGILGLSSRWANAWRCRPRRRLSNSWCGPAMGAFNEWTKGSFLEEPANRRIATVAMNLLYGAGVVTRVASLRNQGVRIRAEFSHVEPRTAEQMEEVLH